MSVFQWQVAAILCTAIIPPAIPQDCGVGWFGYNCMFKCHCSRSKVCGRNGECPTKDSCMLGYFGPGCQYVDLAASHASQNSSKFPRDGNDSTCNPDPQATTVDLALVSSMPVSWFRVVVKDPKYLLNFVVTTDKHNPCLNETRYVVNRLTVDVLCGASSMLKDLRLEGKTAPFVCSVYISGDRNVALRQKVNQSSTYSNASSASKAVDGLRIGQGVNSSCARTNSDVQPKWSLYFNRPMKLLRALVYNADTTKMMGFTVRTYTQMGFMAASHTERSEQPQDVYVLPVLSERPVVRLEVVGSTRNQTQNNSLVLCELEVYGDESCRKGMHGLECNNPCSCTIGEECSPVTGACSAACPTGRYGAKCSLPCGRGCYQGRCDPRNGACYTCQEGVTGERCLNACTSNTFGRDCREKCSTSCKGGCRHTDGVCFSCIEGFYGAHCELACSPFCLNASCHEGNGTCFACTHQYSGDYCLIEPNIPMSYQEVQILLLLLIVALLIALLILICWRKKREALEGEGTAGTRKQTKGGGQPSVKTNRKLSGQSADGKDKRRVSIHGSLASHRTYSVTSLEEQKPGKRVSISSEKPRSKENEKRRPSSAVDSTTKVAQLGSERQQTSLKFSDRKNDSENQRVPVMSKDEKQGQRVDYWQQRQPPMTRAAQPPPETQRRPSSSTDRRSISGQQREPPMTRAEQPPPEIQRRQSTTSARRFDSGLQRRPSTTRAAQPPPEIQRRPSAISARRFDSGLQRQPSTTRAAQPPPEIQRRPSAISARRFDSGLQRQPSMTRAAQPPPSLQRRPSSTGNRKFNSGLQRQPSMTRAAHPPLGGQRKPQSTSNPRFDARQQRQPPMSIKAKETPQRQRTSESIASSEEDDDSQDQSEPEKAPAQLCLIS